jgi:hypothetical protein
VTGSVYAEFTNGTYRLFLFEEGTPVEQTDDFTSLMMSRTDFDIKTIELPPIPEQEVPNLLKFKLRSLYPGNPEDTAYDYVLEERKNKKYAVLFMTRKKTLETYRELSRGRPLFLPFTLLRPLFKKCENKTSALLFFRGSWIESLLVRDTVPIASSVAGRTGSFTNDFQKLVSLLPGSYETYSLTFICSRGEIKTLKEDIENELPKGVDRRLLCTEDLLGNLDRKMGFLFSEKRQAYPALNRLLTPLLAVLVFALCLLVMNRVVGQRKAEGEALQDRVETVETRALRAVTLENEVKKLEADWAALHGRAPLNIFFTLSELSRIIEDKAVITFFLIEKDSFQFEAVGQNPLVLMDRFRMNDNFENMKLLQSIPVPETGKERFKVTGVVKIK